MTNTKNNLPLYAEEQIINEETTNIQQILNQFKQPIPTNFVKLKVEEGNYMGSPKWKDRPNYERYGFYLEEEEEKWVQIDIPHNLVEKLEIVKGDDITYPLCLTIDISQKKLIRGAYTIENEEEVFIDKPVSEKNVEKELVKRLEELERLREQVKELEDLKHKKVNLEEKVKDLEKDNQEKDEENERLEELVLEGIKAKEGLQGELEELKNESERNWKGFYEWLKNNIIEVSNASDVKIKKEFESTYPNLAKRYPYGISHTIFDGCNLTNFWFQLENYVLSKLQFGRMLLFKEYTDESELCEMVYYEESGRHGQAKPSEANWILLKHLKNDYKIGKYGNATAMEKEFNKMLEEYRKATSSQTTAE